MLSASRHWPLCRRQTPRASSREPRRCAPVSLTDTPTFASLGRTPSVYGRPGQAAMLPSLERLNCGLAFHVVSSVPGGFRAHGIAFAGCPGRATSSFLPQLSRPNTQPLSVSLAVTPAPSLALAVAQVEGTGWGHAACEKHRRHWVRLRGKRQLSYFEYPFSPLSLP